MNILPEHEAMTNIVAEVDWVDANTTHGWHEDAEAPITMCRSIGYVIRDDDDAIVLAESINLCYGKEYGCTTAIPRFAVKAVTYYDNEA